MVVWDLPQKPKRRPSASSGAPSHTPLSSGWTLVEARAAALGQADAKSFARSVRASRGGGAWAVRGEVPLEDERSACGCTTVVFDGVRMQLPEKLFGRSYLELRHAGLDVAFCFDAMLALRRWAELSVGLVNARREGKEVWSGWTCDAAALQHAWAQSAWAAEGGRYSFREEWDWVYRTDYSGSVHRGAAAEHSRQRSLAAQKHKLIRLGKPSEPLAAEEPELAWDECDEAAAAAAQREFCDGEEEPLCERELKLYEDHLSELGIARLSVRVRAWRCGWEARVRWWSCLNPHRQPRRGLPHARLRDATVRLAYASRAAVRCVEERSLLFAEGAGMEGAAPLDADEMRPHMRLDHKAAPSLKALSSKLPPPSPPLPLPSPRLYPTLTPTPTPRRRITIALAPLVPQAGFSLAASLGAPVTSVASSEGHVAFAAAGNGAIVWWHRGYPLASAYHRGVEALAIAPSAALSAGSDGAVRVWRREGESVAVSMSGERADRAHDGLPLVQALALEASLVAAGCGCTVLHFSLDDTAPLAAAAPPLPSAVTALAFSPRGLVAGTMHSGAFVFPLSALSSPPPLRLECAAPIDSLAPLASSLVASCADRTARLWDASPLPLTFGGAPNPPSAQPFACAPLAAAPLLLRSPQGLVAWRLAPPAAPPASHAAPLPLPFAVRCLSARGRVVACGGEGRVALLREEADAWRAAGEWRVAGRVALLAWGGEGVLYAACEGGEVYAAACEAEA
ncbi:hypothetical protein AB1Y20_018308 [Prymnesium parvum]|uniref:Uncharacterized protein n=1 Tax=Prymnesium parvum TaxID=97485 RepID=A0AB34JN33_PRYPA